MSCVKTGFCAYLEYHFEWLYGDAFRYGDVFLFRVSARSREPELGVRHYTIRTYDAWFDKDRGGVTTLVVHASDVEDHGYEGVPV